jgi:hypothetical protein
MIKKYEYQGKDLTLFIYLIIVRIVDLMAERDNIPFETAYQDFTQSQTYKILQNTKSKLWGESAEYILSLYDEEPQLRQP